MRLQSAIFDMDGTLVDSMGMWRNMVDDFLIKYGKEPSDAIWEAVRPLTVYDTARFCKDYCHLSQSVAEIAAEMDEYSRDFYTRRVQAKPGVAKVLSLLRMEGVWMYVATATDRDLVAAALQCAGLDGFFRGISTCLEAGANKRESAAVFERAMTRLRSNKNDTVIFEDSVEAIRTAKAAGFRTAGVYDPASEADQEEIKSLADYYIRDWSEFLEQRAE